MIKKIMSLLLIGILTVSVSACGKRSESVSEEQSLLGYMEIEIDSSADLIWPGGNRINSKNQLVFFDRGDGSNSGFVTLNDEGKQVGEPTISFLGNVTAFALDDKDNIYVVTFEFMDDNKASQKLTVISPTGDILKTVDLDTQGSNFTDIAIDADGNIYLANPSKNIQVLNSDGQPVKTLGDYGYESITIDSEGNLIAGNFGEKRVIEKLDASTGKSIWSIDLTTQDQSGVYMGGPNKIIFSKADQCIYYMTSQGITKYDSIGKLIGTAVDFKSYTILANGYTISDMSIDVTGNIYVTTTSAPIGRMKVSGGSGGNTTSNTKVASSTEAKPMVKGVSGEAVASIANNIKYELYKYEVQSGDSTPQKQEVITVSTPVSNRALEIAASKFQKENPGYRIDIQVYQDQDNSTSDYETYMKNLNTQILSGKGPDIISVAGLPYESYISKNILADLSDMMAEDKSFDMNKYHANIFDALKYNEKLYVLPTDFTFNVLMANQEILDQESLQIDDKKWTWDDFKSIAEKVAQKDGNNRSALPAVNAIGLLNLFTGDSYNSYIDKERKSADFTSKGFVELLNTVKAFSDDSLMDSNVEANMPAIIEAASRGAIVFYPCAIADYTMYGFMKSAFKEQLSLYNIPAAGGSGGGSFTSNSMYGINRNSKYTSESWEFLKILLSDDVQSQQVPGISGGFSVNKDAQQNKAQQAMEANTTMVMRSGDSSIPLTQAKISQEDIDDINKFILGLKTYANADANISSIIENETKAFFTGDKSAEETAKLIQDRVNTYLGE